MWTDPTRVKKLTSPQNGRTQLGFKIWSVHKVDGPSESKLLDKSTKWTDPIRVNYLTSPQSGQTLLGLITRKTHKVDGPYKG